MFAPFSSHLHRALCVQCASVVFLRLTTIRQVTLVNCRVLQSPPAEHPVICCAQLQPPANGWVCNVCRHVSDTSPLTRALFTANGWVAQCRSPAAPSPVPTQRFRRSYFSANGWLGREREPMMNCYSHSRDFSGSERQASDGWSTSALSTQSHESTSKEFNLLVREQPQCAVALGSSRLDTVDRAATGVLCSGLHFENGSHQPCARGNSAHIFMGTQKLTKCGCAKHCPLRPAAVFPALEVTANGG